MLGPDPIWTHCYTMLLCGNELFVPAFTEKISRIGHWAFSTEVVYSVRQRQPVQDFRKWPASTTVQGRSKKQICLRWDTGSSNSTTLMPVTTRPA
ncbi:uncharacterized protein BDW47DRAFT_105260 [Aspergillus candidus]|uniref:Uncharacterized protein n=1 Tax=Aspergillus candidus TaxID=41067 RepID=A0A2I2FCJ5_ASPCN|nr:hypothetical protein BDW47DRAFT_105260 [Aspergillus candidus]PLB38359.1 hypothetical protein BDW47DRAFT_105260 [Aspergillus candidus]